MFFIFIHFLHLKYGKAAVQLVALLFWNIAICSGGRALVLGCTSFLYSAEYYFTALCSNFFSTVLILKKIVRMIDKTINYHTLEQRNSQKEHPLSSVYHRHILDCLVKEKPLSKREKMRTQWKVKSLAQIPSSKRNRPVMWRKADKTDWRI